MPTPTPPLCKTNITMWQMLQDSRVTNANALKDLASIAERWDTSPKIAAATPQAT